MKNSFEQLIETIKKKPANDLRMPVIAELIRVHHP
jgi:hypothetical protein